MNLFQKGDTFITHKREVYVFYETIEISDTLIDGIVELGSLVGERSYWPHFSGSMGTNDLYWKIAKPKFQFKSSYSWQISNISLMVEAKYKQVRNSFTFWGRVVDIDLDTLRLMTDNGPYLTDMGNEILWQSIMDLKNTETFDSF